MLWITLVICTVLGAIIFSIVVSIDNQKYFRAVIILGASIVVVVLPVWYVVWSFRSAPFLS